MIEGRITQGLKTVLEQELPGSVSYKHITAGTAGIPDLSGSWHGVTWWLEVKHLNPGLFDDARQRHTVLRLSRVAPCAYVFYAGPKTKRAKFLTAVIKPSTLAALDYVWTWDEDYTLAWSAKPYDHKMVAGFLRTRMETNPWTSKMSECFTKSSGSTT